MEEGTYQHPGAFKTNRFWDEEITMGPGPPRKKKDLEKQRRRGQDSYEGSQRGLTTGVSARTGISSADTIVVAKLSTGERGAAEGEQERKVTSGEDWNRRRYQREDEYLWGNGNICEDQPGDKHYYIARNPAVNDLHPPVVSTQPTHRNETRWMLQPPPSARVMEGKERAYNRPRSGTGESDGSNGSSRRQLGLGRQLGERMMEGKRQRGEMPEMNGPPMSREISIESKASSVPRAGQRHDRDHPPPTSNAPSTSAEGLSKPTRALLAPSVDICTDNYNDIDPTTSIFPPEVSITKPSTANVSHRPPLQTFISSKDVSKSRLSPIHPPLLQTTSHTSLRALQELVSPSAALNSSRPWSVGAGAERGLPPSESENEVEFVVPEVESLWPPPVAGGLGKREWRFGAERRERWSMDI